MIAGVVAGLAKYFGIDPTLARVLYVVGSIISVAFPGILVYVLLWAIPQDAWRARDAVLPNKRLKAARVDIE
jgi:phage shock protein C